MKDLQQELLKNYSIIVRSYKDNSIGNIPEFLGKINTITNQVDGSIIQLLDCDYLCGYSHLNQAIAQAIKAFDEKQNFANDKGLEICVRASAQKQISQALKLLGIKEEGNITVVYINTTGEQVNQVEVLLANPDDSILEIYDDEAIREAYELGDCEDIVGTINEKIALLSIKY